MRSFVSDADDKDKCKRAFDFSNSCRNKEIDRFWSRALYFWGFIAASFTAYITVLKLSLGDESLSFDSITKMEFTVKIILAILSFVCFVFCFLWQLIHKASKFWQENWENYVCEFEKKIFKKEVYGNPKTENIETCAFPLSLKPVILLESTINFSPVFLCIVIPFVGLLESMKKI